MSTTIPSAAGIAKKIFNAALYLESTRLHSLTNMLTGPAPTLSKEERKTKSQTAPGAPIVRISDLEAAAGDEVSVDLFTQLRQKPRMGDKKLAGYGASLKFSTFKLKVDQGRTMVDSGGAMSRQRTEHDLRKVARALLTPYYMRLEDQLCLVHLAGARGSHNDADWIVPTAADPEFAEITVNPVTPPTFDRHFYGGDATAIDNIDAADTFSLDAVDNIRLAIDEMPFPIQPIKHPDDPMAEEAPFYMLLVTPRQWNDFWTSTGGQDWRTLQARAYERRRDFKHPVFTGDVVMWNNILVRKQRLPIRFEAGEEVSVSTNTASAGTTTLQPAVRVERAILIGGQALANAYGGIGAKGRRTSDYSHFSMNEEETDHKNVIEHSIAWMNGKAKVRFEGTDGRINDHGCAVLDTAVS